MAQLFTEYEVARGILKFQCKTWQFRATSYSVNIQVITCKEKKKKRIKALTSVLPDNWFQNKAIYEYDYFDHHQNT